MQKERAWYKNNNILRYRVGFSNINNRVNILSLKKDIYYYFDNRWFVIVLMVTIAHARSLISVVRFVTHIISKDRVELWPTNYSTLVEYFFTGFLRLSFYRLSISLLKAVHVMLFRSIKIRKAR